MKSSTLAELLAELMFAANTATTVSASIKEGIGSGLFAPTNAENQTLRELCAQLETSAEFIRNSQPQLT